MLVRWPAGLELRTLGSQATTLTAKPTRGYNVGKVSIKHMDIYMMDKTTINFCAAWTKVVKEFDSQVKQALPEPSAEEHHGIQPGDWVYHQGVQAKECIEGTLDRTPPSIIGYPHSCQV